MRTVILLLLLVSVVFSVVPMDTRRVYSTPLDTRRVPDDAMLLEQIETLTFKEGYMTSARRTPAVKQLECIAHGDDMTCLAYAPNVVQCKNRGVNDRREVQWKCEADLDKNVRFGSQMDVSCEGYHDRDDPYVLEGSCALQYELEKVHWINPNTPIRDVPIHINEPIHIHVSPPPPSPSPQPPVGVIASVLAMVLFAMCMVWCCGPNEDRLAKKHRVTIETYSDPPPPPRYPPLAAVLLPRVAPMPAPPIYVTAPPPPAPYPYPYPYPPSPSPPPQERRSETKHATGFAGTKKREKDDEHSSTSSSSFGKSSGTTKSTGFAGTVKR
jgi:hypothetical protein